MLSDVYRVPRWLAFERVFRAMSGRGHRCTRANFANRRKWGGNRIVSITNLQCEMLIRIFLGIWEGYVFALVRLARGR